MPPPLPPDPAELSTQRISSVRRRSVYSGGSTVPKGEREAARAPAAGVPNSGPAGLQRLQVIRSFSSVSRQLGPPEQGVQTLRPINDFNHTENQQALRPSTPSLYPHQPANGIKALDRPEFVHRCESLKKERETFRFFIIPLIYFSFIQV